MIKLKSLKLQWSLNPLKSLWPFISLLLGLASFIQSMAFVIYNPGRSTWLSRFQLWLTWLLLFYALPENKEPKKEIMVMDLLPSLSQKSQLLKR